MARRYKLEHFTKGTGANVVPSEEHPEESTPDGVKRVRVGAQPRRPEGRRVQRSTSLPAGHVRKKATGEIGRVLSVDPKGGTASVRWLKQGRTSTVRLSEISRR